MRNVEDEKKKRNARICKEIERKRESARNVENTRRVYSVMKKENRERERERERERDFPRRGDERRIGNSVLERDKEREKGGRGRRNSEIEQETKSGRIWMRKSWI